MLTRTKILILIIGLALWATACDGGRGGGGGGGGVASSSPSPTGAAENGAEVSIHLGKEEAISKVQEFLERREGSVTVQLPFTHLETVSQPCSQMDVDTDPNKGDEFMARCKPVGGSGPAAPYGSRTVTESRTECCKSQTVRWTTLNPVWTAVYSKESDSWDVSMEFDVEAAKKAISWIVQDKTGAVTEQQ